MRILSERELAEIKSAEFKRGIRQAVHTESEAYAKGYREGRFAPQRENLRRFNEAPIIIESITLTSAPKFITDEHSVYTSAAQYLIKFRSKSGKTTSDVTVYFDTQDFSMADVRRKITEEFCGGDCR